MISLSLAWRDQYFIMFKDLDVFELTNFPFKAKCNNTVVYSVNSNYFTEGVLFHRGIKTEGVLIYR